MEITFLLTRRKKEKYVSANEKATSNDATTKASIKDRRGNKTIKIKGK